MSPLVDRLDNAMKNYNATVWSSQLRRSASQRVEESSRIGANEGDGYAVVVLSAGAIVGALVKLLNRFAKGWTTLELERQYGRVEIGWEAGKLPGKSNVQTQLRSDWWVCWR